MDECSAGPVEPLPCVGVSCGLAVFGVPLGAVVDPFAFAAAVECAVAAAVDEAFGWLCFVAVDVVGFEWCAVEVFGGVAVHGACAVFTFGAVYEVVEQVLSWHFVLCVAVAALFGGFGGVHGHLRFWWLPQGLHLRVSDSACVVCALVRVGVCCVSCSLVDLSQPFGRVGVFAVVQTRQKTRPV